MSEMSEKNSKISSLGRKRIRIENDREWEIHQGGIEEGIKHCNPSPLTKTFMEQTKTDVTNMKISMGKIETDISYIKESIKHHDAQFSEIICKIDGFIQSADDRFAAKADHYETMNKLENMITGLDKKYAPRSAWTIMVWAGRIVGAVMLAGLLTLIYKLIILIEK